MHVRMLLVWLIPFITGACTHSSINAREAPVVPRETTAANGDDSKEGGASECNSAAARIHALMAQGKFAEAEAFIAEASAGGLISRSQAARLLNDIARLNTKLGDIPATLQRAKDFPSQLREYTLHEIERMLNGKDFSIATQAQLKMARKLILESPRLMGKGGDL